MLTNKKLKKQAKKEAKQKSIQEQQNLYQTASSLNAYDYVLASNSRKDQNIKILEKREIENIKSNTAKRLNDLYDVILTNRLGETIKNDAREIMRKNENLKIYNSPVTCMTVSSFLLKYVEQAIEQANRNNKVGVIGLLNTISDIVVDASSAPQYYYDQECLDVLAKKVEKQAIVNQYEAEIQSCKDNMAKFEASFREDPTMDQSIVMHETNQIRKKSEDAKIALKEANIDLENANKTLLNVRRNFELSAKENDIDFDELIKTGKYAKARREAIVSKRKDDLSELSKNDTEVSNDELDMNKNVTESSNKEITEEKMQEMFKI